MRYAVVKNTKVINVLEVYDPAILDRLALEFQGDLVQSDIANIGNDYVGGNFIDNTPPPPDPVWKWYLDIGPFYDRLGAFKMAILTSQDAGVKALLQDIQIRKWIDLKNAEVATGLAYIGSIIPALTPAIQTSILTIEPTEEENLALRRLYF